MGYGNHNCFIADSFDVIHCRFSLIANAFANSFSVTTCFRALDFLSFL